MSEFDQPFDAPSRAQEILEEALAAFPIPRPSMVWRAMRVTAGIADYNKWQIRLSSKLLTDEERLRTTLLHEFAHLLAVHRHGRAAANHGPQWKQAMQDVGLPPIVRHRYPVEPSPRKKLAYTCERCGYILWRQKPIPRGRIYRHTQCGGTFRKRIASPQTTG